MLLTIHSFLIHHSPLTILIASQKYRRYFEKAQNILPYMEKQNWLLNYQFIEGIQQILTQMDRRTNNKSNMRFATEELTSYYTDFENEFTIFFKEIKNYSSQQLNSL